MLIDLHSHLLPNVDDGSRSLGESVHLAKEMAAAGFGAMSCTSHFWENLIAVSVKGIPKMVAALQKTLDEEGVTMRLVAGAELNFRPNLTGLPLAEIPSYNMAGKYYLGDTWEADFPAWMFENIRHLQSAGGKVIFAHPERNDGLLDDPLAIERLAEVGCLFQLNYYTLADAKETPRRSLAERYLREGRYSFAASDLHQTSGLPERLAGLKRLEMLLSDGEKFQQLVSHGPRQVLVESGVAL